MVSPYAGDWIFPARCSENGLSLCQLAKIVKRETGKSPHPIRHGAATEIYTELPAHRDYGRVMLGQKRQSSTDGYAQHANARIAGRQHKEIRKHEISRASQSRFRTQPAAELLPELNLHYDLLMTKPDDNLRRAAEEAVTIDREIMGGESCFREPGFRPI